MRSMYLGETNGHMSYWLGSLSVNVHTHHEGVWAHPGKLYFVSIADLPDQTGQWAGLGIEGDCQGIVDCRSGFMDDFGNLRLDPVEFRA